MARGNLPAQTPLVPSDIFVPFDLVFRYLLDFNVDVGYLEGIRKKSNTSVASTTTLADDPDLQFDMKAQRKYRIDAMLFFNANLKLRHTGPAAPSVIVLSRQLIDGVNALALDTAYSAADIVLANIGMLHLRGIIHNGANAGKFKLQWAQNASNATPSILYAGSVLRYSPVD